jgi:hypothetical protein
MRLYIKVSGSRTMFRLDAWKIGTLLGYRLVLGRQQVVRGGGSAAIASASGGTRIDAQARAALDQILAALGHQGLIDT